MIIAIVRFLDRVAALLRRLGLSSLTRAVRQALERWFTDGLVAEAQGFRVRGGIRDRAFLYHVREARFEPETAQRLSEAILPGMVVCDVGAYLGFYTLLASRRVGPSGRVYAFEPDPASFQWLQRNVLENACHNVVASSAAIGVTSGKAWLYRNATDASKSSLAPRAGWLEQIPVETVTPAAAIDAPSVDVVKMDVEGSELGILLGMEQLLARSGDPLLVVELNPTALGEAGTSENELLVTLRRMGFESIEHLDRELGPEGEFATCNLFCRRSRPADHLSAARPLFKRPSTRDV
jgi:FkbM family methyltransferase